MRMSLEREEGGMVPAAQIRGEVGFSLVGQAFLPVSINKH
jgi:hypothetical protein